MTRGNQREKAREKTLKAAAATVSRGTRSRQIRSGVEPMLIYRIEEEERCMNSLPSVSAPQSF
jgi:hypothetical protein